MNDKIKEYPKTEYFEVFDTYGVPHPFMIGTRHVTEASDHHCGRLDASAIEAVDNKCGGHSCYMKGCTLSYREHETALVVKCGTKDQQLLNDYLMSIKEQCEKDHFAGFVLVLKDGVK